MEILLTWIRPGSRYNQSGSTSLPLNINTYGLNINGGSDLKHQNINLKEYCLVVKSKLAFYAESPLFWFPSWNRINLSVFSERACNVRVKMPGQYFGWFGCLNFWRHEFILFRLYDALTLLVKGISTLKAIRCRGVHRRVFGMQWEPASIGGGRGGMWSWNF